MRRAQIMPWVAVGWLWLLAAYSLRLWGGVFGSTRWGKWLAAAADACAHAPALLAHEPGLLVGPLVLIAGWLLGRALLRRLLPEPPPPALSLAAGLAALALAALALGSAGLFRPAPLLGLAGLGAAAGLIDWLRCRGPAGRVGRLGRAEWLLLAPFLLIAVLTALNPTLFYDALYYHFSLPRLYLNTGSTAPRAWHAFSYFPSNAEMLFGTALAGGTPLAPQLLLVGVWAAAALAIRDTAARFVGVTGPALLAALLTATFLLATLLVTADPLVLLFSAGGLYCLLGAAEAAGAGDRQAFGRWAAGWALMAGAAGGVKFTAWVTVMALPFLILTWLSRGLGRNGLAAAALAGVGAFLVLLPWPLRSLMASGNPVMPVPVGGWLAGLAPEAWRALTADAHTVTWSGHGLDNLLFPWTMVFGQWEGLRREWGAAAFVGPALWMGLPLAALFRRRLPAVLWGYGLLAAAVAALMNHMVRFAYPGLGALCVIAGAGLAAWLAAAPRWARAMGIAALAAVYVLTLALVLRTTANQTKGYSYPRLSGDLAAYLTARGSGGAFAGSHLLQFRAAGLLPPNARVLMVGDGTFFFIDREVEAPTFLSPNRLLELFRHGDDDGRAADALMAAGFTHVLVSYAELDRLGNGVMHYTPELEARLRAFVGGTRCRAALADDQARAEVCELVR